VWSEFPRKKTKVYFERIRQSPEPEHISPVWVYLRKATNLLRLCIDLIPCRNHVIVLPEMIGHRGASLRSEVMRSNYDSPHFIFRIPSADRKTRWTGNFDWPLLLETLNFRCGTCSKLLRSALQTTKVTAILTTGKFSHAGCAIPL
jgi:hypothetical protein